MEVRYKIYSLSDPRNDNVFYIGVTVSKLKVRLNSHCTWHYPMVEDDGFMVRKRSFITELKNVGLRPDINLLAEVSFDEIDHAESFYYYYFISTGATLLQSRKQFYYTKHKRMRKIHEGKINTTFPSGKKHKTEKTPVR